jgi:hypothetical protein
VTNLLENGNLQLLILACGDVDSWAPSSVREQGADIPLYFRTFLQLDVSKGRTQHESGSASFGITPPGFSVTLPGLGLVDLAVSAQSDAVERVPGPVVGAGLPGLILACGGLLALARRRRQLLA